MTKDRQRHLVLFDIGAVLLHLDFERFYKAASSLSSRYRTQEGFKEAYASSKLESDFMKGLLNSDDFLDKLRGLIDPNREVSSEELKEIFSYRLGKPVDDVVKLKKRLRLAGYSVGIFSNTTVLDFAVFQRYPDMLEATGPSIYSFQNQSLKPEPKMYGLIKGFDSVTFIDDKESYLRTGVEQFGWNGILFTPFIDRSEAIRAVHTDTSKPQERFRIANSVGELEDSLRHFGIQI